MATNHFCSPDRAGLTVLTRIELRKQAARQPSDGAGADSPDSATSPQVGPSEQERSWVAAALAGRVEVLGEAAVEVAVESGELMGWRLAERISKEGSVELAKKLALLCEQPGNKEAVSLRRVAVMALDKVVRYLREQGPEGQEELPAWLTLQAGWWLQTGRYREAVAAAREALDRYRRAPHADRFTHRLRLAVVLDALGGALDHCGELEEALRASREAVDLLDGYPDSEAQGIPVLRAGFLMNLAARHRALGQRKEAVDRAEEAVEILQAEAKHGPEDVGVRLAAALTNLGVYQQEIGEADCAAVKAAEGEEILQELAKRESLDWGLPGSYSPMYAASLLNLAILEAKLGRHPDALQHAKDALKIYQALPENDRALQAELAAALTNLTEILPAGEPGEISPEHGQGGEPPSETARRLAQEAVDLWRALADEDDIYQASLGLALNNLSGRLAACGSGGEALATARDAAELLTAQAALRPTVVQPLLALTLNNLTLRLVEAGEVEEACRCQRRAVRLYEALAREQPPGFQAELAGALLNLAARLEPAGALEEAPRAARRAGALYWRLGEGQAELYRRSFTDALTVHQVVLERFVHSREQEERASLIAPGKALALFSFLATSPSHPFLGELLKSLSELRRLLHSLGRSEEALDAGRSAVAVARELFEASPESPSGNDGIEARHLLSVSLNQLGLDLRSLSRRDEALSTFREGIGHWMVLDRERPEAFRPYLAASIHNRALVLQDARRLEEALAGESAAERLLEPFARQEPAQYRPWLEEIQRFRCAAAEALDKAGMPESP